MSGASAVNGDRTPDSSTRLRVGLAGTGLMGYWHAANIKGAGGRLVAVADPDAVSAQRVAVKHGNAAVFSSHELMLAESDLDVLHVCTPLPSHQEIVAHALEAGVDILVEKPLVPTAADTERLLTHAAQHDRLICPVHQFAFQKGVREASECLAGVGRIVQMDSVFYSAGGLSSPDEPLDSIVADILPHPLSIMQMLISGDVPSQEWTTVRSGEGEFFAICETSGITLSIRVSMSARPTECSFRVVGTTGTIHLDFFHGFAFVAPGSVSKARKIMDPFDLAGRRLMAATLNLTRRAIRGETAYPGLRALITSFYDAVRSRSAAPISPKDTLCVARVRDHLIESGSLQANQQARSRS